MLLFCRPTEPLHPACQCRAVLAAIVLAGVISLSGCGTTKSFDATQQLLLSEAVDSSVAAIDFRPLTGQKVFLDTTYLKQVKTPTLVNADYVISALRQQITSAGCLIQSAEGEADIIIEARLGALGSDGFQITYGMPPNSLVSSAASLIPGAPQVPTMPELSLARRETSEGAAKIAAFAYDRVTREPLWQSGTARSTTTARDVWILGIGPLQTGSIRGRTRLVGSDLEFANEADDGGSPPQKFERPAVNYNAQVRFNDGKPVLGPQPSGPQPSGPPASGTAVAQQAEPAPQANPAAGANPAGVPAAEVAEQLIPSEPDPAVQR